MNAKAARKASYQLKVTLEDTEPPVWRRIVVPGVMHLGMLHQVIQVAMGWDNAHLHEFEVRDVRYGVPDPESPADRQRDNLIRVHEALPEVGVTISYLYDFGDGWMHDIVLEAVGDPVQVPSCIGGARACPPEDCGGPWGYANMIEALADPAHPDHEDMVEWIDEFDAEKFEIESPNKWLSVFR